MKASVLFLLPLFWAGACWAQPAPDDVDWTEAVVPPPPAFNVQQLIHFEVSINSSMVFGIDPASLVIASDGVVRYIVVATNPSGARNVFYEGVRCASAEVKTYGWQGADGQWRLTSQTPWRSLYEHMPSKHARVLAQTALCQGNGPVISVPAMVQRLRQGGESRY